MTVEQELRRIGFSNNEVKVYLGLLRLGRAKAGKIASECMLERTSTYNALKRLQEKGVVASVIESSRSVFSAAPPAKILEMFREQEERAAILVPKLEALKRAELEKESIQKFRGYAGIKTVFADILRTLKTGEEYLIMGTENQMSERMPTFARIFVAKKDAKKLRARILIREGRKGHTMSTFTKARYVPQEVISPTTTNIYAGKVALILWSETPEAIIIDDAASAKTYRSYFEFMWKHAKE